MWWWNIFFFQAEDGIRDRDVTGVQTCALPIWKVLAGLRPVSVFAVEADYLDLGSQTSAFVGGTSHSDAKAFAAYAVGFLQIGRASCREGVEISVIAEAVNIQSQYQILTAIDGN